MSNVDKQYLSLVKDIIGNGEEKHTRAGDTLSVFSRQIRINLKDGFPLITTKKVYAKGIIHELLWFLSGDTNIKYLVDNNVHIWDDDAYRHYLTLVKRHNDIIDGMTDGWLIPLPKIEPLGKEEFIGAVIRQESIFIIIDEDGYHAAPDIPECWRMKYTYGDLDRIYGAQWTSWDNHNQIQEVIDTLKTNPDDRRMIVSAWNVADIPYMALPPCHYCCQFYTKRMTSYERVHWACDHLNQTEESIGENMELLNEWDVPMRKLSCVWHQRSVDTICGLPFNIASYALLTHMVAQCANMDVDELIFDGGDCHIYKNQLYIFWKQQGDNDPEKYDLPTLRLNPDIKDIFKFTYDDIHIDNYLSYPPIRYLLNVGL